MDPSIRLQSVSAAQVPVFVDTEGPNLWRDPTGSLVEHGSHWAALALEMLAAPALEAGADRSAAAVDMRRLATQIVRSLRGWQGRGGLELRYLWGGEPSLRLVLVARGLGPTVIVARGVAGKLLENVAAMLPGEYVLGSPATALEPLADGWAEIARVEEVRTPAPWVPTDIVSEYYLPHPFGGDGTGWPGLMDSLARMTRPGFLSIALVPTELVDDERSAIDHVCSVARHLSQPQQGYDFFGGVRTLPADEGAAAVENVWSRFPGRSGVLARIGVSTRPDDLMPVASLVGSALTRGAEGERDRTGNVFTVIGDLEGWPAYQTANTGLVAPRYRHEVWSRQRGDPPYVVQRMPYFFSEEEAGGLLVLPVPDAQGVPGMPLAGAHGGRRQSEGATVAAADGVQLGHRLNRGVTAAPMIVPVQIFNRHTLVVGSSGAGKTTTVLTMLAKLWREHRVPFLVIEPSHTEYRSLLATEGFSDLRVIAIGRDDIAPFRLNPLEPPPGVGREAHTGALLAALKLALPLFPPLPQLLEEAIEVAYERAGWGYDTTIDQGREPPTIRSLIGAFAETFEGLGYRGEAENLGVALGVRLRGLLRGARGRMLDTVLSSDFQGLMERPTVVELADIADQDDKLLIAALLLSRIRAACVGRRGGSGGLRHLTVIEEAHRILGQADADQAGADAGDGLRREAVRSFADAIAELRSYGEGFILSSQRPSELAPRAVANTALRIVHGMQDANDREAALRDMDTVEFDSRLAARLVPGEALVWWSGRGQADLARIAPPSGVGSSAAVSDQVVRDHMARVR